MEISHTLNIYSEALFPSTEGSPPSTISGATGSSQYTQTQVSQRGHDEEEEEDDEGSDVSLTNFTFKLSSAGCRGNKISQDFCTTGCDRLDDALNGGMPAFGITEIFGEAGSGKTQFCLQLAIVAQLPVEAGGLDAGVFYISTEDALPTKRLAELVKHFQEKFGDKLPENPMSNIFIEHVTETETLLKTVEVKLASLVRNNPFPTRKIRLVIIDSIAAIFRAELEDISGRTQDLRHLGQILHEHSLDNEAVIIVCNQVTANPDLEGNVASLGMAWRNMITTRIRLSREEGRPRNLFITFSPHIASMGIDFNVSASGVAAIDH